MAITPKFREFGTGGAATWTSGSSTDQEGNTVTLDEGGASGGTAHVGIDSGGYLFAYNELNSKGAGAFRTPSAPTNFADGTIRGTILSGTSIKNNAARIFARKGTANGNHVTCVLVFNNDGGLLQLMLAYGLSGGSNIANVTKTLAASTSYKLVFVFNGSAYKLMSYLSSAFPPASNETTPTWDINTSSATPPVGAGQCGFETGNYNSSDINSATAIARCDRVLAWALNESATVPTVVLTQGAAEITISVTDVTDIVQKEAAFWYFMKYKAGSAPAANASDGTLLVPSVTGTGLGGSGIRSDGRFIDEPTTDPILTGLTNGTTYFVRPYALMPDGTIVAGTAQSATPDAGDTDPPVAPGDFAASYDDPFVAGRIVLSGTQPTEDGESLLNRRTDQYPTAEDDGSATVVENWTAYTPDAAYSYNDSGLAEGQRYFYGWWHKDATGNVSVGAFAQRVALHQIFDVGGDFSDPADGETIVQVEPYLVWDTEAGEQESGRPVHYRVQISTDESSEANFINNLVLTKSSMTDGVTDFEYEQSTDVWVQLPVTGLASADVGKKVRFKATGLNTEDHYYWRVTPQQPGA